MNNLFKRILMFFTFVPLILLFVFVFVGYGHLALQIATIVLSIGLAVETAQVFGLWLSPNSEHQPSHSSSKVSRLFAIFLLSASPLVLKILENLEVIGNNWSIAVIVLEITLIFSWVVVRSQTVDAENNNAFLQAWLMIIVYPILGIYHFLLIINMHDSGLVIFAFLTIVFANDTLAYLSGILFGRNNTHVIKVSPNKSLAGFVGGLCTSIIFSAIFYFLMTDLFAPNLPLALVIGLVVGVSTILGDLFESVLKRGSGLKDSGSVIPGRGGLLDSCDSLIFSAPVFYYLHQAFNSGQVI